MSAPIVRFAPSPTGLLHVGNIRAALETTIDELLCLRERTTRAYAESSHEASDSGFTRECDLGRDLLFAVQRYDVIMSYELNLFDVFVFEERTHGAELEQLATGFGREDLEVDVLAEIAARTKRCGGLRDGLLDR